MKTIYIGENPSYIEFSINLHAFLNFVHYFFYNDLKHSEFRVGTYTNTFILIRVPENGQSFKKC